MTTHPYSGHVQFLKYFVDTAKTKDEDAVVRLMQPSLDRLLLDITKEEWMVEGGTPNTLLRRGVTRESLKVGTELVIDGYQARDHSLLRANGRNVTYPDGTKLFLGSSGTGAPTDGADPTEAAKPGQRGRGGR